MRLFQNYSLYPAYKPHLGELRLGLTTFTELHAALINDRFGASHLLQPVLDGAEWAFSVASDDIPLQKAWATENGLKADTPLDKILLAQIEHHRADVFYNLNPMTYGNDFLGRLPGCVRATLAWRAAPSAGGNFENYDALLSNVGPMIDQYRSRGMRVCYFSPAHDPEMDRFAAIDRRPVDVAFVGGYSRHHTRRARIVEAIAELDSWHVSLHLNSARSTRLADSPLGLIGPLRRYRRPRSVRVASRPPVFGRDLYHALGKAKIVINGAIDMAGNDRANMRCWEALGCGALMIGEAGQYPPNMTANENFVSFESPDELPALIEHFLENAADRQRIARAGYNMITERYSKDRQWGEFEAIVADLPSRTLRR